MEILGFSGSPRRAGNTDRLVRRVLAGAKRCQEVVDGMLKLKRKHRELAGMVDLPELVRRSLKVVEAEFAPLKVATGLQVQDEYLLPVTAIAGE